MTLSEFAIFVAAGLIGGAVNALAGGAKLFVFPLLLASGLPPIVANATGTIALWPAQLPAVWVYRHHLRDDLRGLVRRLLPALVGAGLGATALIWSSERAFVAVVPFFLILAVLAIAMGNNLPRLVARLAPPGRMAGLTMVLMFIAGLYGGYFGAGLGFMLLAVLTLAGLPGLQSALAEKNLAAFLINTTAAVPLLASGLVSAPAAGAVILGGLAGGYLGARLARVVPDRPMRFAVALMGLVLTLSFLFR